MIKTLCVFCGSNPGRDLSFVQEAKKLGRWMAGQGIALVYGGASIGVMGAVADGVLEGGGKAIGVIPTFLMRKEIAHAHLTEMHVVESMHVRKKMMYDLSDGFISLPGGFGTLDEFCEILTWGQLGHHQKPCGLLNINGFWDPLVQQFDRGTEMGLIQPQHRNMVLVDSTIDGLLKKMSGYRPLVVEKWLGPV